MNRYSLRKGLLKIFFGELFSSISSLLNFTLVILSTWALSEGATDQFKMTVSLIVVVAGVFVLLLSFVGLIFTILGLKQVREEDSHFQKAYYAMFAMIIAAVAASFISADESLMFVLNEVPQIINIGVSFYLLKGLQQVIIRLKEDQLASFIQKTTLVVIVCFSIVSIGDILIHFVQTSMLVLFVIEACLFIGYVAQLIAILKGKMLFKKEED